MYVVGLRKPRTFLLLALLSTFLGFALLPASFAQDVAVPMFGPQQYVRTTKPVDTFTNNFVGVPGQGTVTIENGDGSGHNLVEDLLITINGVPLANWSALMQPPYKLEAPISMNQNNSILVILLGKSGSYLTFEADAEITPDATTTQTIGIAGGTLSVENHLGDIFTLTIPPLALDQNTSISASALPNALPSPIAQNLSPGVVFGPTGLYFGLPATLTVALHQPLGSPWALLFSLQDSNFALPVANQTTPPAQNSMQGEIYHFSPPIDVEDPTPDDLSSTESEIDNQAPELEQTMESETSNSDWYTYELNLYLGYINALLSIAQTDTDQNKPQAAANATKDAATLTREAANILTLYPPKNPCGENSVATLQLADDVTQLLGDASLAAKVAAMACTFTLDPPLVDLFVAQTYDKGIIATLKDPNGNIKECTTIDWYDDNEGVAAIGYTGNFCLPTGMAPGLADVWAVCDGQPSKYSTPVSVCGLIGTYQGTYSGVTVTHTGGTKPIGGSLTMASTQSGTNVSADIFGFDFTGTSIDGNVNLGPVWVSCYEGTRTCPFVISGSLSPDCSTFTGSFSIDKKRFVYGSFSVTLIPSEGAARHAVPNLKDRLR